MSLYQFNLFCGSIRDQMKFGQAPWTMWPRQREVADAFDKYRKIWIIKARTMGLSELAGLHAFKIGVSEPNSDITIISQKFDDAKYFVSRRIGDKVEYAYNLKMDPTKRFPWPSLSMGDEKIVFGNKAKISALSSESNSARSRTNRLVVLDEFREFPHKDGEEILSAIQGSFQIQPKGQLIVISTALHGSYFNEITEKILKGQLEGWKLIFLDNKADPQRTSKWLEKQRKSWVGTEKGFWRENPRTLDDCFAAREGAVWSGFDPNKHVQDVRISNRFKYLIVYDHGRKHPCVTLFALYDKWHDHLYIFDELYCREMELPEVAMHIRRKLNHYKKYYGLVDPVPIADRQIFAKDGRKTVAAILRTLTGITFRPSDKRDRDGTTDAVGVKFANNQITIDPKCEELIDEVKNWRWKEGDHKREVPEDKNDNGPDCLCYLHAELHAVPKKKYESEDVHFNPRFNQNRKELQARFKEIIHGGSGGTNHYSKAELEAWQGLIICFASLIGLIPWV